MDLEEWELLHTNNYIDLDLDFDNEVKKMIGNTRKSFDLDYFICPIQDSVGKTELYQRSSVVPVELLQVPVTWEPISTVEDTDHKNNPDPDFSNPDPELLMYSVPSPSISFKKTKELEFSDMKIDSPAVLTSPLLQKYEKHCESEGRLGEEYYDEVMRSEVEEGSDLRNKKEINLDEDKNICRKRMNPWKIGFNGIGALCSFGVAAAAATICVFFLGHTCRNKNQIFRFQIYSDDDKKMNEVMTKCPPVARAQIYFGG